MSEENQVVQSQEVKNEAIEVNLSKQRKMYERQLEQERLARQQAEERIAALERLAQEKSRAAPADVGDDQEDDEPYVDRKKLRRELNNFQKNIEQTIDQKAEAKAAAMIEQERRDMFLNQNSDFEKVMKDEELLEKFALKHKNLADNILRMPNTFERQKLVYETIKTLGIDKPEQKGPSVQEKIDANRKSPYYQPSGVGAAPYASASDFSDSGQKSAYAKMQELKKRLRI